jgi:predicted HicB family RNase H-like nuclease
MLKQVQHDGSEGMRRYTERIDFTLPVQAKERLKAAARREGVSMSELVRRQVRKMMDAETSSA